MLSCGQVFVPLFEETAHAYCYQGRKLPSVTQILKPISEPFYRMIDPVTLKNAADRGSAIHECLEYLVQDDLEESSILPDWVPYIDAFKAFCQAFNPVFISTELKLACPDFAGTIDVVCTIDSETWVIDYKTTKTLLPGVALQTAAYELLARGSGKFGKKLLRRGALQLKDDGTFKFEKYTDLKDYETFEYLLKINQWMREKNV